MYLTLNKVNKFLLAFAIILIPFNSLPYFKDILREMSNEGAFYPLSIAILIWGLMLLQSNKVRLPQHISVKILGLFVLWIFLSISVNLPLVSLLETKGRTGIEKFLFQLILLTFVILSSLLVYNVTIHFRTPLHTFRRYVTISFLVAGTYSLIEIAFLAGNDWATYILQSFNPLIHEQGHMHEALLYFGRLRSVSGEASWFAMYCSFIFPWIFSYTFTERRYSWIYWLLTCYLFLLVILTISRTAYVIVIAQLVLFLIGILFVQQGKIRKGRIFILVAGFLIVLFIATITFKESIFAERTFFDVFASLSDMDNLSNIGRFGSQIAAFNIALDYPFWGVGFGQYGFYMPDYVPQWAKVSVEIQEWMNATPGTSWAPVQGLYSRIIAELGFIGLMIWIAMWLMVLIAGFKRYRINARLTGYHDTLGLSLLISIIGVLLSGLNADSLRFFGYWILLGMAWVYLRKPRASDLHMR